MSVHQADPGDPTLSPGQKEGVADPQAQASLPLAWPDIFACCLGLPLPVPWSKRPVLKAESFSSPFLPSLTHTCVCLLSVLTRKPAYLLVSMSVCVCAPTLVHTCARCSRLCSWG